MTSASRTSEVVLPISAGELRADSSSTVVIGFAVEPADGSSVSPEITKITGPNGQITPLSIPIHGTTPADKLVRQTHLFARVIPLTSTTQDITLNVGTLNKKTGSYIVEAYLVGDVNGDGTVDATDLSTLQVSYGSHSGQTNYNAAADLNGDGRVGCIDRKLLQDNLGAHVIGGTTAAGVSVASVSPIVPLAGAATETNLVPTATSITTPVAIAIATPVATTTVASSSYVPVTLTPSSAVPAGATATSTPVVLTSVSPGTGATATSTTGATPVYVIAQPVSTTSGSTASTTGTTPVYVIAQPVATTTGSTATAPVYLYGQPVVSGTSAASSAGATLFGQTPTGQTTTTATPIPVYLYNTPNYTTPTYSVTA